MTVETVEKNEFIVMTVTYMFFFTITQDNISTRIEVSTKGLNS